MSDFERRIEPHAKWIRGVRDGRTVVDSRTVALVWTHPYYPAWAFPEADVTLDAVPTTPVDGLADHVSVNWDAVDHWYEEDVEVFVHPRDPYKRIDALASSRHVKVLIDGVVVADSHRATLLFETMLPVRYYLPATDVRFDLLTPTDSETACPYKGWASYWTASVNGVEYADIAWSYRTPLPESEPVAGLVCFYNEKVEIVVDGLPVDRPVTHFS